MGLGRVIRSVPRPSLTSVSCWNRRLSSGKLHAIAQLIPTAVHPEPLEVLCLADRAVAALAAVTADAATVVAADLS